MKSNLLLAGIFIFCLATVSLADVVIETSTEMNMIGAGEISMAQVQYVRGDRSYDETTTQMAGGMMGMGGSQKMVNIQINRLDKGVGWTVNPKSKSYTEFSFDQMKGMIADTKQKGK